MITRNAGPRDALPARNRPSVEVRETTGGWQIDQMIGDNPIMSFNLALMAGAVVGWFIKRR